MSDFFDQSLVLIEGSDVISRGDLDSLSNIRVELQHNFKVGQVFRSKWEMRNSVLNDVKYPTPDSKYWQAVREQQTHFQELVMLSYDYYMNVEDLNLLEITLEERLELLGRYEYESIEHRKEVARINKIKIEAEKLRFIMLDQQRVARNRVREVLEWHEIMEEEKPNMEHGTDSYEEHQGLSYLLRFTREMEIAQNSTQSPSEKRNLTAQYEMAKK